MAAYVVLVGELIDEPELDASATAATEALEGPTPVGIANPTQWTSPSFGLAARPLLPRPAPRRRAPRQVGSAGRQIVRSGDLDLAVGPGARRLATRLEKPAKQVRAIPGGVLLNEAECRREAVARARAMTDLARPQPAGSAQPPRRDN